MNEKTICVEILPRKKGLRCTQKSDLFPTWYIMQMVKTKSDLFPTLYIMKIIKTKSDQNPTLYKKRKPDRFEDPVRLAMILRMT